MATFGPYSAPVIASTAPIDDRYIADVGAIEAVLGIGGVGGTIVRKDFTVRQGGAYRFTATLQDPSGVVIPRAHVLDLVWHLRREDGLGTPYRTLALGEGIEWDPTADPDDAVAVVTIQRADLELIPIAEDAQSRKLWHCGSAVAGGVELLFVEGVVTLLRGC